MISEERTASLLGTEAMIRRIELNDIEIFRDLRLESLRLEPSCFASSAEDWGNFSDNEWKRRITASAVFMAFVESAPSGIIALTRHQGVKVAHRASVGMVYVRAHLRGTGEAARLMNQVFAHARSIGVCQLELTASSANPRAISFYEKKGFSEVGRIPNSFLQDGLSIDDVLMVRQNV
jgi:GNAT superfamily N-acetyltransferase